MTDVILPTYSRLPVAFAKGAGAWVWDTKGKKYLDALSGIAVTGLGHAHPQIRDALCDQAGLLLHTSNLYEIELQTQLALALTKCSGMESAFFCNSGAEANEAALKMARLYGHQQNIDVPTVVVMENSFHGRTMATLSATGNNRVQAGFEPLVAGFERIAFNDMESLNNIAKSHKNIVAVFVEPVQGEGGIRIPSGDYLESIRQFCDTNNWLMILDEIQTGMGRTGKMFCFQHFDVLPDILTVAKGLGNGIPIGACLTNGRATTLMQPGSHGSTFGGNPFACRAALTVIDCLTKQRLPERAKQIGAYLTEQLRGKLIGIDEIVEIRHFGLMIGIELKTPCGCLVEQALEHGLLLNVTAQQVIRLLPPLILSTTEADEIVRIIVLLIKEFDSALKR